MYLFILGSSIVHHRSDTPIHSVLMGKRTAKHPHTKETQHTREANRVRFTVLYLLRKQLDLPVNPDCLDDPQPLTKLDVILHLQNVQREYRNDADATNTNDDTTEPGKRRQQ